MTFGDKGPWRLALCAAAMVAALAGQPARAQNAQANGADAGGEEADQSEFFRPTLNTSISADNMLRVARNLAAAGAYPEAGERLLDIVTRQPRVVAEAGDGLYLPLWRIAAREIASWPVEGLAAYRATVRHDAQREFTEALRAGNLVEIEHIVNRYFLTDVGDNAAVALADRLRETGWPALALFYYTLVLDAHPDSDIPRTDLVLRAALAAREAGMDRRCDALTDQLGDAAIQPDPDTATVSAAQWIAAQHPQPSTPGDTTGGFGNLSDLQAIAPATVTWKAELSIINARVRRFIQTQSSPSTPPVYPILSDHILYVANLYSAWAIDTRTGAALWRYDTREADGEALPQIGRAQARQPLLAGNILYVPLEKPPPKVAGDQRQRVFGAGGLTAETDLYALDAHTGRPLWHWSPRAGGLELATLSVDGQPAIAGDLILVALASPSNFFGEVHTAAVNRRTGALVWAQPLAAYLANFSGQRQGRRIHSDTTGTGLAVRGGILLSSGIGVTTAQSCLTGDTLWSRVMTDMRPTAPTGQQRQMTPRPQQRLVEGMALSRRPRVLADRGIVVAGFALSPNLVAYDWIDGHVVWQQNAQGARQPLGITGDLVVSWGQTVMAFDLQTGQPRRASAIWPEPIVGEPVIAAAKVMAPTRAGITTVDLTTGDIELTSALPPDIRSGNLVLGQYGLVIVSESGAACMHDWDTARTHFLDLAAKSPTDALPLIALGAAALRLEKAEDGLRYLDDALARDPPDSQRARIYHLFESFYRIAYLRSSNTTIMHLLDRLRQSAASGANRCRQAFLRAEYVAERHPRAAIQALQEILDDPASRHIKVGGPAGPGVSAILAEEAIACLLAAHGRGLYAPWERAAADQRTQARARGDYAGLLNVAQQFPNSDAAREALDDALALLLQRKDLNEANRLLMRLVNMTHEGDRETRYRALLIDTSARLGSHEYAALQAAALAQTAARDTLVPLADDSTVTVGNLLARVAAAAEQPPDQEQPLAAPPYRMAWKLEGSPNLLNLQPVNPIGQGTGIQSRGSAREMLYLWNSAHAVGIAREDGRVVWDYRMKADPRSRPSRCYLGRTGLYVFGRGKVIRLDPDTGTPIWEIHVQPESGRHLFAPRGSVTGTLAYGDTGWKTGSNIVPNRFDELGDKFIVNTRFNLHLIDPRDGYTIQSIGYPQGVFYGGFIRYGHTVISTPMAPPAMRNCLLFHDLATGNLVREVRFGQQTFPSAVTQHGDRYWPILSQADQSVRIVDMERRTITDPVRFAGKQGRLRTRQALADRNVLYAAPDPNTVQAFDVVARKALWTYPLPDKQAVRTLRRHNDALIVTWADGIALLAIDSGKEVWQKRFTGGTRHNIAPQMVTERHIFLQVNQRIDNRYVTYAVLLDRRTGDVVFEFRKPDKQQYVLAIDPWGVLVRTGHREPLEYWVHDPQGESK